MNEPEKKDIGTLFDGIASTYDRFNHILSAGIDRRWRRRAVRRLLSSDKLLDVAIGTADFTLEVLRQQKASSVTGLDLSREMMKIGEEKVAARGFSDKVKFCFGSALEMPFEDSSFNAVTCAYGVRNFSDLDKGLSEMYRVLAPGGQLMILEFSYPENRIVRILYDLFFTHVTPVAGKLISRHSAPYVYFRNSVKGFIWGNDMLSHIESAGFSQATFKTFTFGITTLYTAYRK